MSALVHEIKETPYLFETDGNGYLRVWNINSGAIHKTISITGINMRGLCLWNDQYIITAASDKTIKVFDINTFQFCISLTGHENVVCSVKKVVHPVLGECLVSSAIDGKIKLWAGLGFSDK